MKPRVVVIGGGVSGLVTAYQLGTLGAQVVLLEAEHLASGSSGLSVGIVETQYVEPFDIALRAWSMAFFDELEQRHGLEVTRNGYLRLAHSESEVQAFRRSVDIQRDLGITTARQVDRDGLAELVPHLNVDDLVGGLFGERDGFVDGPDYCNLLARLAREAGAEIRQNSKLVGAEPDGDGFRLRTQEGAELRCDVVVNAAGAWAGAVGARLGAPVRLLPQRHQVAVIHLREPLPYVMPSVMDYTPGSGRSGVYFRHERPGELLAGLHTEEALADVADPDDYSRGVDPDFVATVVEGLNLRLRGLEDPRVGQGWAGLYPVSLDGRPHVGPHPDNPAVVAAYGVGGSGIQLSPIVGRLAAEWVVHGEPRALAGAQRLRPRADAEAPA